MAVNTRKIINEIITKVTLNGEYPKGILDTYRDNLDKRDYQFIHKVVNGTLEEMIMIDAVLSKYSKIKLKKYRDKDLNILRTSVYEMLFVNSSPDYAVINEAVKMIKKSNFRLSNVFNGILRNIARNKELLVDEVLNGIEDPSKKLSIKFSHPEWMVNRWVTRYGDEFTEQLLKHNNMSPALTIRTNTTKISSDELLEILEKEGIKVIKGEYVEESIKILDLNSKSLTGLSAFKDGLFTVQDEASMLACKLLDAKQAEQVLDLCAAPGGKSTFMAEKVGNAGRVVACDISDRKTDRILENITRLGLSNVVVQNNDALEFNPSFEDGFDKVLLDAPCSGLGIIRKKADIRYNRTYDDVLELADIQQKMLKIASRYVKPGGVLVYSTCTLEPEENENNIQEFLNENDHFVIERSESIGNLAPDGHMHLFPNVHGTDGFYACRLRRIL